MDGWHYRIVRYSNGECALHLVLFENGEPSRRLTSPAIFFSDGKKGAYEAVVAEVLRAHQEASSSPVLSDTDIGFVTLADREA